MEGADGDDDVHPNHRDEPRPLVSRVGEQYQAALPPLARRHTLIVETNGHDTSGAGAMDTSDVSGTPQWLASCIRSGKSVDTYLSFVQCLFHRSPRHYSEPKALHFLHQCDYQITRAMKLLRPCPLSSQSQSVDSEAGYGDDDMYVLDDFCFVCRDGGSLILCDHGSQCKKVYHPACAHLDSVPSGLWCCPYHQCAVCQCEVDGRGRQCAHCPQSYCQAHIPPLLPDTNNVDEWLCDECHQSDVADSLDPFNRPSSRRAFIKRVQSLLKRESRQMTRLPRIQGRTLDLAALYRQVRARGGLNVVVTKTGWKGVLRALDLRPTIDSIMAVKGIYVGVLLPYEKQFFAHYNTITNTQATDTADAAIDEKITLDDGDNCKRKKNNSADDDSTTMPPDDSVDDIVAFIRNLPISAPAALPTAPPATMNSRKRARAPRTNPTATASALTNGTSNGRRRRARAATSSIFSDTVTDLDQ